MDWPTEITLGSASPFRATRALTEVPREAAMLKSVSPGWMT
jgi:hypothetical protein